MTAGNVRPICPAAPGRVHVTGLLLGRFVRYRVAFALMAGIAMSAASNVVPAEETAMPADCNLKSRSDAVAVVVCKQGLGESAWRDAGKAACEGRNVCNAWIWDDPTKAPLAAPRTDADLHDIHSSRVAAVWVNDMEMLITVRSLR